MSGLLLSVTKSCPTLLWPSGLQPSRLLCPWDFSGKNTAVGCHCLLQGIFPTQGSNPGSSALAGGLFCCCKLIYFNWRLITLQYCGGFCHTFTWICHGYTCVPHPEPPSHLPPHPIPQGHPTALALSTLLHALNLDWRSISHMVIYMFRCCSLKSSHQCLFP